MRTPGERETLTQHWSTVGPLVAQRETIVGSATRHTMRQSWLSAQDKNLLYVWTPPALQAPTPRPTPRGPTPWLCKTKRQ